jgi:hypothetical protein
VEVSHLIAMGRSTPHRRAVVHQPQHRGRPRPLDLAEDGSANRAEAAAYAAQAGMLER